MPTRQPFERRFLPGHDQRVRSTIADARRARDLFERAVSVRSDVDLLAEEYGGGELLGGFPPAFSHVGPSTPRGRSPSAVAASPSRIRMTRGLSEMSMPGR